MLKISKWLVLRKNSDFFVLQGAICIRASKGLQNHSPSQALTDGWLGSLALTGRAPEGSRFLRRAEDTGGPM